MNLNDLKKIIPQIFIQVKSDVKQIIGKHRAGLSLGLAKLGIKNGNFIGGLFFYPGTEIIMNVDPILILMSSQPEYIVKAYVYHVLLHEYIHSLGLLDEYQCRKLVLEISKRIFKDDHHPIIKIALEGIGIYLPNLQMLYIPPMRKTEGLIIEYLSNFDEHGLTYYS